MNAYLITMGVLFCIKAAAVLYTDKEPRKPPSDWLRLFMFATNGGIGAWSLYLLSAKAGVLP